MQVVSPMSNIFFDRQFAWKVLESQINVELSEVATGDDVSKLLALYMIGVQKMNSVSDPRELYFKNKVTQLMSKHNVIRGLNMSKKRTKQLQSSPTKSSSFQPILIEKKKQLDMRLAYGAQQHSPQALNKLLTQQKEKQTNLSKTIEQIVSDHDKRLSERIKKRKQRATTAQSNVDQDQQIQKQKNNMTVNAFSPTIEQISNQFIQKKTTHANSYCGQKTVNQLIKPKKSKKKRRNTVDQTFDDPIKFQQL